MIFRSFIIFVIFSLALHSSSESQVSPEDNPTDGKDYCQNPETQSQRRILDVIDQCSSNSKECPNLSDCLAENLVKISEETMVDCRKSAAEGGNFRPCSVAATAYVILEQIRRLLIEETIYRNCSQVKQLFEHVLRACGDEEGAKILEKKALKPQGDRKDHASYQISPDPDDMIIEEILAKFLIGIGKKMQTFDSVRADIADLERSKHMKALAAMCVSFALPGLLGLCEAAHFRTGLFLQILALFVIGIYQFSRYGGYWAFVGVGSCLLIMIVEFGLMILIRKRILGETDQEVKKTE